MLFRFDVTITGNACCLSECLKAVKWFVAHVEEHGCTVQTSKFDFHPAKEAVVLQLSAYVHSGYLEALCFLHEALEAIPGHDPSLVGMFNCVYELTSSFDISAEISGWTSERQMIALSALFAYFGRRNNRDIADILGIGIGTVQRYRQSEQRRMHPHTFLQILDKLRHLEPVPPQSLIEKFQILVSGDDVATSRRVR